MHGYSVVDVGERGGDKYLRLRNSWGDNKITFDEWSLCSPELAGLLKMENVPMNRTWVSIHRVNELDSNECDELLMCELIQESSRDISLIPGDYILMITELLGVKEERNVAIYTSIPISARICSWSPKSLIDVFQKAVGTFGMEMRGITRRDISIQKYTDNEDSFMVVMAENYTIDKYLHVHIHFSHTAFIQFSRNDEDKQFADVIPPRRRQILIVAYHSPVFDGKGFGMNVEYWVSKKSKTKIGRSDRAEHVPSIRSDEYVHFTTVID
ncbi:hypothetical protein GCK72_003704 [Caenorhabditis remanei]|uniref:Calpain catalytic domain-containing protein n=1 Tax=Caenorhabditis remanei TaxID=31234 RepID=A0A6A5H9P5_CAERE|nr:hypothetical protein GCK72_003704 [Caenorhabditis remanei]KAF1763759.1 hypothetical protein GCK72_003704 [Caenorhabditis remanei]